MSSLDVEVQGLFHFEFFGFASLPENSHQGNQACLGRLSLVNLLLLHQVPHELQYSLSDLTMLATPDNPNSMKTESPIFIHKVSKACISTLPRLAKFQDISSYMIGKAYLYGCLLCMEHLEGE
jgi:hypothetical protein